MVAREEIEAEIRQWLVPGEIEKILLTGFEFACLEAEHKGMPKKGHSFVRHCKYHALMSLSNAYTKISNFIAKWDLGQEQISRNSLSIEHCDTQEIRDIIMKKYGSKRFRDYLSDEEFPKLLKDEAENLEKRCNHAYGWGDVNEE